MLFISISAGKTQRSYELIRNQIIFSNDCQMHVNGVTFMMSKYRQCVIWYLVRCGVLLILILLPHFKSSSGKHSPSMFIVCQLSYSDRLAFGKFYRINTISPTKRILSYNVEADGKNICIHQLSNNHSPAVSKLKTSYLCVTRKDFNYCEI